ncbi:Flagellar hook-associated protein 1 [Cedecea neteri]|uniref:Flagellar hook-associated protein 1 n=1 Tax=Cedecea neteri TaxID=158822 RepID=A0A2X3L2H1_9ENTR|nr:Flagellar hook-associated protein 1 [Cedecea neteri]
MSNSLINSAMSGLSAAQAALSTVGNNISNYNVSGYTRQTTILSQSKKHPDRGRLYWQWRVC